MLQAGVILSDYATLMVEILKDNARPEAGAVYGAMDMPWAKLVGQIAQASASNRRRLCCADAFETVNITPRDLSSPCAAAFVPNLKWPSRCNSAVAR
jgi:hypothetical protein